MPGFHEIAAVTKGQPIPDWRDIMELTGNEHAQAISLAARAVWSWMHARAEQGDKEYRPVTLSYYGGADRPAWHDGNSDADEASLTKGWRWDGVISATNAAYVSLWPSLAGKLNGKPDDADGQLAGAFRGQVGSRLKHARNVVCVVHGGSNMHNRVTPQWFVADKFNDTAPPPMPKKLKAPDFGSPLQRITAAAEKLTPQEAGETKTPAPVITTYACLDENCSDGPFPSTRERDAHAAVVHAPAEVPGDLIRCRAQNCETVFNYSNRGNRRPHELAVHPELAADLYPITCGVPDCKDRFDNVRGLGQHLGASGHGITDPKERQRLTMEALDKATSSEPDTEEAEIDELADAAPETAVDNISASAAPAPAPAPALASDPVAAIQAIIDSNRALQAENEKLRQDLEQKSQDAALSQQIRSLFEGGK
jgi:hypothetical protein